MSSAALRPASFHAATILLPAINETYSLRQTVEIVLRENPGDIAQIVILVCAKTTAETMKIAGELSAEFPTLVSVHEQTLPFLGGAIREGFALARGSHVVMMASDLETDPADVRVMIARAKAMPEGIVTATRWAGGTFEGYSPIKLLANWIFQKAFAVLYGVNLSDMTYGYRLFPTQLVQAIDWKELRHPFLFETIVKPLRLGVKVVEIPSRWSARTEGTSQNTFLRNFVYFRTGVQCRLMRRDAILVHSAPSATSQRLGA
jgi:hypothetical protein